MNYLLVIDNIINVLVQNNKLNLAEEIQEIKLSASTSSELLMMVGYRLKELIGKDKEIDEYIKKDVLELLNYCNSIGLNIGNVSDLGLLE
jgi:hypothetical protein